MSDPNSLFDQWWKVSPVLAVFLAAFAMLIPIGLGIIGLAAFIYAGLK